MGTEQVYFETVETGDEIGPEPAQTSKDQIKAYLVADGGPLPENSRFFDDEAARAQGLNAAIVPGALGLSLLSKVLTDWAGPAGKLRKIDVAFRRMAEVGDPLQCQGIIIDKEIVDGEGQVRIDVSIKNLRNNDSSTVGTAVVVLPLRSPGTN